MPTPPYAPPSVGPAGLVVSNYPSIMADNLQAFLNIYGVNQYVTPDSFIYQLISLLSLKQADVNLGLQLAYNQSSPQTAIGAGLDRIVKMNGLARAPFSYSTAVLHLTGVPGTVITNGVAQDTNGNLWALPASVTLAGGAIDVTATCTTPGSVAAQPSTINIISTPTLGWNSVTNTASATLGLPVETDSRLRARQAVSVALPSKTPLAATLAAIMAVPGVSRIAPGYPTPGGPGTSVENPTGTTDSWGNVAHSITMVVEGGADLAVATAVYNKKTIGCAMNGTTSVAVTDPATGFTTTISFYRPTYAPIYVNCTIHGYAGTPTTAVVSAVQTALVNYLNALAIGETVSIAALSYEAMAVNTQLNAPAFGVQTLVAGLTLGSMSAADVAMPNFHSVASGVTANVTVATV